LIGVRELLDGIEDRGDDDPALGRGLAEDTGGAGGGGGRGLAVAGEGVELALVKCAAAHEWVSGWLPLHAESGSC